MPELLVGMWHRICVDPTHPVSFPSSLGGLLFPMQSPCCRSSCATLIRGNGKKAVCACSVQMRNSFLIIISTRSWLHLRMPFPKTGGTAALCQTIFWSHLTSLRKGFADLALETVAGQSVITRVVASKPGPRPPHKLGLVMHPGIPITDTSYSGKQRKEIWSVWPYGEEEQIKKSSDPQVCFWGS